MSTPVLEVTAVSGWEAENAELDKRFLAAMAAKDIDAAISCFLDSPELVVVLWGNEMRGPAPLRASLVKLFDEYDEVKLAIEQVDEFPSGDAVVAVGIASYTLTTNKGEMSRIREIWTDVRRKVDGRWVYVLDHAEVLQ